VISLLHPPGSCGRPVESAVPDACYLRHGRLLFSMTCV
jgi:hypothetical protein